MIYTPQQAYELARKAYPVDHISMHQVRSAYAAGILMLQEKNAEVLKKTLDADCTPLSMNDIPDEVREIAVRWGANMRDNFIDQKVKLASDIVNYAVKFHKGKRKESPWNDPVHPPDASLPSAISPIVLGIFRTGIPTLAFYDHDKQEWVLSDFIDKRNVPDLVGWVYVPLLSSQ